MATKYRKPRSINTVSLALLALLGLGIYLIIATWPVYSLSSRAKGVLLDALPVLYRANLRPESTASVMIRDLKKSIPQDLRKQGVRDPNLEVILSRSKEEVSIEAHFAVRAVFPGINKTFDFHLSPRVVTDSARVEW